MCLDHVVLHVETPNLPDLPLPECRVNGTTVVTRQMGPNSIACQLPPIEYQGTTFVTPKRCLKNYVVNAVTK